MTAIKKYRKSKCIEWTGHQNGNGYGRIYITRNKSLPAHRVVYQGIYGPIPKHLVMDHLCRNKLCINPKHLRVVTNRENVLCGVGISALNAKKTHCYKGHPLYGENLRINKKSERVCKECHKVHMKMYHAKRKLKSGGK